MKNFTITTILTENFKQQLVDFTINDPLILENTSDGKRFTSLEQLEKWLGKTKAGNREFFFLSPSNDPKKLGGMAWLTKKSLPTEIVRKLPADFSEKGITNNPTWTYAIRLYKNTRGKKLATPFLEESFKLFWKKHPHQSVWLLSKTTNQAAQKLYNKFNFEFFYDDGEKVWGVVKPKL